MTSPRGEQGESLLEVLIAVAIMGIAVVAIMAGLVTSVLVSDVHRKQSTAGTAVRDYAEAIQSAVATGNYQACGTSSWYQSHSGFTTPAGFTPTVVTGSMRYWSGSAWQSSCTTDLGLQQLTVQVASDDGRATERVDVVLRKPCGLETSC
ncbi:MULTISPECIES: prepilin-type N-terminal cleavage/methylation domain-containing protein [Kribbella]|jgi:Tfp pilus assembly protein PilV|uniref:Pilin/secretion family protein with methylation motif n=1 Tax=Kribbella pratensis TaxID=2512112 RepID=A0ABY2F9D0_9ACTN|nr:MULTISPECIES: type II secretion system protein [Kribbella]TDW87055.1 pilin/secretion family protein with methylation motif [Kribbella pratensis]TDW91621.1 pilin/secretion family protein with methylation motif [Kribbella sp. VKM Ac-2566]